MKKTIGVLALQGAFTSHVEMLTDIGAQAIEVREPEHLARIDALILPGGESTTMSKLLVSWGLIDPIRELCAQGLPIYGTCAGMILLADRLSEWNDLPRIGGLNMTVTRNAYGRQIDSFEAKLLIEIPGSEVFVREPFNGIFIRAPQIEAGSLGSAVEVLASFEGLPVLVRQKTILAGSFHPELSGDSRLHAWFVREMTG
ncbi:MAG: pyridoxal 5'-phosphate synthase glutaminase subunit PdxT [spirochete symbiont of Stewartia floridana]|nr:MAG: pyridoxal 5'-phosphate synthase glutaminase subunit PdxT [spirochete symbiont of Stewartia floridana]